MTLIFLGEFPKLKGKPNVTVGVGQNEKIRFTCDFEPENVNENAKHKVYWYTQAPDGNPELVHTETLHGNQTQSFLQNTFGQPPKFCLQKNVSLLQPCLTNLVKSSARIKLRSKKITLIYVYLLLGY